MVEVDLPRGQYRCLGEGLEVASRRANVMAMFGRSRCLSWIGGTLFDGASGPWGVQGGLALP